MPTSDDAAEAANSLRRGAKHPSAYAVLQNNRQVFRTPFVSNVVPPIRPSHPQQGAIRGLRAGAEDLIGAVGDEVEALHDDLTDQRFGAGGRD